MKLLALDIGGTALKYGYYDQMLTQTGQVPTPMNFVDFTKIVHELILTAPYSIEGIAISAPGAVNIEKRRIEGISAVPYIHGIPIFDMLESAFKIPVTIENDANCAGICEMHLGAGKDVNHAVFVVIGTGVGGAIFINGQLYKGAHLFAGEFGLMKLANKDILSAYSTVVKKVHYYNKQHGTHLTGQDLFDLAQTGDIDSLALLDQMYDELADALYQIQVTIDPEIIIIGGGISRQCIVIEELNRRLHERLEAELVSNIMPSLVACQFHNEANLLGAVLNFKQIIK